MNFYDKNISFALDQTGSGLNGLTENSLKKNIAKYGYNVLSKKKEQGFFARLFNALKEPMLIILTFSFIITLGTTFGKFMKTGEQDFAECLGILFAIILSVSITLIMEGSSQKAFAVLSKIYDNVSARVVRNGKVELVNQQSVTVGDVILIESGDKIIADGRLLESNYLSVDESALTGENHSGQKNSQAVLASGTPLAERVNSVYSGTFVRNGNGKMLVTATGDDTEIGKIARELKDGNSDDSPLKQKLARLGKIITLIGLAVSVAVFVISIIKLSARGTLTFSSVQNLFISCIVLIVAAVPEGLPTIVAVSLALNMIKLAGENALIKKMIATETAGAVSVICSDKTGTLTQNKMSVYKICSGEFCYEKNGMKGYYDNYLIQNFILNSTAQVLSKKTENGQNFLGSGTECALLDFVKKENGKISVKAYRDNYKILDRIPFSSEKKYMVTVLKKNNSENSYPILHLLKGAPEKVLYMCNLLDGQRKNILTNMEKYESRAGRIIAFAHRESAENVVQGSGYTYDGFAVILDPVRPEVKKAVQDCKKAGIKVKILTGDNMLTALAVARELKIADSKTQALSGADIDRMDDATLKKALEKVCVVARSTPIIKLRIVKLLKECGEVVAVTGDGINDAPAIKNADIGISMGITGSEITKESADVILLDDSFATIVKAIAFGRNVYRNLQRFIIFQLTVNLSALIFVTVCAVMGEEPPFNTLQLLWINVIMDGPPAITLGLESSDARVMDFKPVCRTESIVSLKMFIRILVTGIFTAGIIIAQYFTDFLGAGITMEKSAAFTLFILFQLFNAFNSRELGSESIFSRLWKNRIMVITFGVVFAAHVLIVQCFPNLFGIAPMSLSLWIKCLVTALSVVIFSEIYKFIYRAWKKTPSNNVSKLNYAKTFQKIKSK